MSRLTGKAKSAMVHCPGHIGTRRRGTNVPHVDRQRLRKSIPQHNWVGNLRLRSVRAQRTRREVSCVGTAGEGANVSESAT